MPLLSSHRFALAAALVGAGLVAASAAHAFTMQDGSNSVSAADQGFLYPDQGAASGSGQSQGFKQEGGMTTLKEGNTTFQFGHQPSFDQQYNTDHLFEPLGHPTGER